MDIKNDKKYVKYQQKKEEVAKCEKFTSPQNKR